MIHAAMRQAMKSCNRLPRFWLSAFGQETHWQERIETVGDDADLQEVYDTERHLLYVACTRARDYLLVTSVAPASEFLDDMRI